MSIELEVMETYVQRALDEFNINPLATQLLKRLSKEEPDLFFKVASEHLGGPVESKAHKMMAMVLLRQDKLFERLASPRQSTHENSVRLLRRLMEVDPSSDMKFAKKLPSRKGHSPGTLDGVHSARALDILDETSSGRRLLPILGHLSDSDDPKIASKATLFVGRRVKNPAWAQKQLERGDERVRASAVESLWGLNTQEAIQLLEECTQDRHNRVIGNALVGLHIAGKESAREALIAISRDSKPGLRATAAWAMGKLAIPDFIPRLTEMVHDENLDVRSRALKSLICIRRFEPAMTEPAADAPATPEIVSAVPETAADDNAGAPADPPPNYFSIPSWARG